MILTYARTPILMLVWLFSLMQARADRLQRFLKPLRARGTGYMLVTSDMSSLGPSEQTQRRDDVKALLQPHSSWSKYNSFVDKFVATKAPDVFSLYVNSTAHAASPYGPAIPQEGINELITCALVCSLPCHDKGLFSSHCSGLRHS
jgi:hypothetical protein